MFATYFPRSSGYKKNHSKLYKLPFCNVSGHTSEACIGATFFYSNPRKLPGTGYGNDKVYPAIRSERLKQRRILDENT